MRQIVRLSLIIMLLLTSAIALAPVHAQPYFYRWMAPAPTATCTDLGAEIRVTSSSQPIEWTLPADNQVIISLIRNGVIIPYPPFTMPAETSSQVFIGLAVLIAGDYPITFAMRLDTYVGGELVYRSELSVACSADSVGIPVVYTQQEFVPAGTPIVEPVPGPDMVALPSGSVVGAFVSTTPAYFAPEAGAATNVVIAAGKTLWVLGVDPSGDFYRVVLAGSFLWVPVETMGPNYDEVWQGRPLPTVVVQ